MKKTTTLCLLLCFGLDLAAQGLPNYLFDEFETIPCPFDSTETITAYKDWLIYQTLDGTWQGPIDSSRCLNVTTPPFAGISLQGADMTKPVFLRCKLNEINKMLLQPNFLYQTWLSTFDGGSPPQYLGGTGCAEGVCSGLFVGVQIPDAAGTGTAMRWYTDIPSAESEVVLMETCVPTEYFAENYLREFVIKLTPLPSLNEFSTLKLQSVYFAESGVLNQIDNLIVSEGYFNGSFYDAPLFESVSQQPSNGLWNSALLLYDEQNGYPSPSNPSYVEARPETNTGSQQTLNLRIHTWQALVPQPFTFIRGALVDGNDSIRHNVNLVNDGGDICLTNAFEFTTEGNTKYIHGGGHVNFEGKSACMMFRNGGTLEVADGVTFQYGQEGKGILGLQPGGGIKIGNGSTLLIENTLWLQGRPTPQYPDPQFYMELNHGSTLAFGKMAHVTNNMSISEDVKLNVYMNGGTLDDSQLNPAARQRIRRIYPKPKPQFAENVKLLQNPVQDLLTLGYVSGGAESVLVEVFDMQGKKMGEQKFEVNEGFNTLNYAMFDVATGMYLASVSTKSGRAIVKVTKQ